MQDQLLPELFLHFPTNVQTILPARTLSRMFLYLSLSLARTRMLFCLWFARAWTTIPLQLRAVEHWCSMNTNTRIAVLVDDVVVVFVLNVVVVVSVLDDVFVVVVDVDSDSDDGPRPVRAHLIRYIG
jgi:hypothetical protein